MQQSVAYRTARELAARFPAAPTRTLARMLATNEPRLYRDVEQARAAVRWARGQRAGRAPNRNPVPCEIPEAIPSGWKPVELPDRPARWLIMADLHLPYHDPKAVRLALDYAATVKAHGCVVLGDLADFYAFSDFEKDPRVNEPRMALDGVDEFLDTLTRRFNAVWWYQGNHERRLFTYAARNAPQLLQANGFDAQDYYNLARRGIRWVANGQPIVHHALTLVHGNEWRGVTTPVNPARRAFLQAKECVLVAHSHRKSEHEEKTVRGRVIASYSVGCLCDLHPAYNPLNNWTHGLAVLHAGSSWRIDNRKIINGEVL